jgi:hypothetical protein
MVRPIANMATYWLLLLENEMLNRKIHNINMGASQKLQQMVQTNCKHRNSETGNQNKKRIANMEQKQNARFTLI